MATHKKHLSDGPDILNELGRLLTWKGHKSMLKTRRTEFEFISNLPIFDAPETSITGQYSGKWLTKVVDIVTDVDFNHA